MAVEKIGDMVGTSKKWSFLGSQVVESKYDMIMSKFKMLKKMAGRKSKKCQKLYKNNHIQVFEIAEYKADIRITKFQISDTILYMKSRQNILGTSQKFSF